MCFNVIILFNIESYNAICRNGTITLVTVPFERLLCCLTQLDSSPVMAKMTHSAMFVAWSPMRSKYLAIKR